MSALETIYRLAVLGRRSDRPGPLDPAGVGKILVVRNDNIGDVLCTGPALDALRAAFPRAYIAALVCTLTEEAISGHRALDKVFAYPKAKHKQQGPVQSLLSLGRVLGEIRAQRFDLALAFRSNFSTSQGWLAYASRAVWRVGPPAQGKKAPWGFYYNLPTSPMPEGLHEVERCFHLLGHIQVDSQDKRLYLSVPEEAAQQAAAFLFQHGLDGRPGPLMLNVTRWAYRPDRLWPEESYRKLAALLARRPEGLVITHAPADRQWVAGILKGIDPAPPSFCTPSLKQYAAMLARARVFLTAEGGPMHVAAAVGAPEIVLWGNTPMDVWHPWGVDHRMVGGRGPVSLVGVGEVVQALDDLLGSLGARQSKPA